MKTALFCIPLKQASLQQYLAFCEQTAKHKKDEWKDMLSRYDIHSVKIWHKHISGRDYVFVYHDVGPQFKERLKGWSDSDHPFDKWFNQQIMAVYDVEDVDGMEQPHRIVEFMVADN